MKRHEQIKIMQYGQFANIYFHGATYIHKYYTQEFWIALGNSW